MTINRRVWAYNKPFRKKFPISSLQIYIVWFGYEKVHVYLHKPTAEIKQWGLIRDPRVAVNYPILEGCLTSSIIEGNLHLCRCKDKSNHRRCPIKKIFLKISQIYREIYPINTDIFLSNFQNF